MAETPGKKGKPPASGASAPAATDVTLRHYTRPPRFKKPKRIHPRHVLPFISEGAEREFHSTSPRAMIAEAADPGSDLKIDVNTELTKPGSEETAGNVGEPSTAINGQVVFYTGNWYAGVSTDGGKTFRFIDPTGTESQADVAAGRRFCCDQVINYIPQIDTFVWLLQYGPETGDNIQRVGFAKSADVGSEESRWTFFDLTTAMIDKPGAFMDFPDLAVGANSLYVTTNLFLPSNVVGSAVFRIPIASIESGNITTESHVDMSLQSFRVAQNCGTIGFFAAHEDTSTLRVFSWPEGAAQPTSAPVGVARWIGSDGYTSRTPDGRRWLDRADPRITGATMAGNELWFAWSVDRGSNHRSKPFVQIARISAANITLLENINVFDPDSAIAYGALATNAKNEVGISYMIGGAVFPSHVVGILTGDGRHVKAGSGDRGPVADSDGKFQWGDYLTVRPVPGTSLFAATGYTLKGKVDGINDATPRFVVFGRARDVQAPHPVIGGETTPPAGGGTGPATVTAPTPPATTTGPISDVNTLPTVSSQVAFQIKTACGIVTTPQILPGAFAFQFAPELVTSPGKERWPVKTGQDDDIALVGKNIVNGQSLGAGIVATTVEELITAPRPADMSNVRIDPPGFLRKRALPLESIIWRIEGTITVVKLEADGDYHVVVQGASGETMVAEVPTPSTQFIGNSPWLESIKAVRQAIDDKLVSKLSPNDFIPLGKTLVPRESVSPELQRVIAKMSVMPKSFLPPNAETSGMPAFMTKVKPTPARLTGVGFFDRVHGQTGVSQSNGIELHPILKIEWL